MTKFALGQSVTRIEDAALLRGEGRYADDVKIANAAHASIVRSPHAHAKIKRIDTAAAKKAPGVLAVLTGADVAADGLGNMPCLVPGDEHRRHAARRNAAADSREGRVRHVGDPVAVVVAETLAQARDAAELVEIDYEPLPSVVDTKAAIQPGAPRAWEGIAGNLCFDVGAGKTKDAVEAALAGASHVTRLELINNRLVANPMEPRAAIADYDAGHRALDAVHARARDRT